MSVKAKHFRNVTFFHSSLYHLYETPAYYLTSLWLCNHHTTYCTYDPIHSSYVRTMLPCSQNSSTALHRAAFGGSVECVEYLLPHFGDRKFVMDANGRTCLHYAVEGGSLSVMRYLVDQCGFDLSLRTGVSCGLKDVTVCIHQCMVAF